MDKNMEDTKKSITDETITASYQVGITKQNSKKTIELGLGPETGPAYKDSSAPRRLPRVPSKESDEEDEDPVMGGSWFSRPSKFNSSHNNTTNQ